MGKGSQRRKAGREGGGEVSEEKRDWDLIMDGDGFWAQEDTTTRIEKDME